MAAGLWLTSPAGWLPRTGIKLRNSTLCNRVWASFFENADDHGEIAAYDFLLTFESNHEHLEWFSRCWRREFLDLINDVLVISDGRIYQAVCHAELLTCVRIPQLKVLLTDLLRLRLVKFFLKIHVTKRPCALCRFCVFYVSKLSCNFSPENWHQFFRNFILKTRCDLWSVKWVIIKNLV